MYEDSPHHIWGPDTQASPFGSESLQAAARLIDLNDPALPEITQAAFSLTARLGNTTEPDEDTIRMAIRLGRARYQRMQEGTTPPRGASSRESMDGKVYYVRRGAMIKIGTTTNLHRRMAALLPEEVLAVEPGSHAKEAELHRLFRDLRVPGQREWFYAGRPLQDHIKQVLDEHGAPPAGLPTLASSDGTMGS